LNDNVTHPGIIMSNIML